MFGTSIAVATAGAKGCLGEVLLFSDTVSLFTYDGLMAVWSVVRVLETKVAP